MDAGAELPSSHWSFTVYPGGLLSCRNLVNCAAYTCGCGVSYWTSTRQHTENYLLLSENVYITYASFLLYVDTLAGIGITNHGCKVKLCWKPGEQLFVWHSRVMHFTLA